MGFIVVRFIVVRLIIAECVPKRSWRRSSLKSGAWGARRTLPWVWHGGRWIKDLSVVGILKSSDSLRETSSGSLNLLKHG